VAALLQLSLLTRATSDENDPTPGSLLPEINRIFYGIAFLQESVKLDQVLLLCCGF